MTQPHKPGCTCTATHEGPDPRAETWEERFDKEFGREFVIESDPENYIHRGLNPAQHMSNAKSFIASEIQSAVEAERKKKTVTFKTTVDVEGYVERGREEERRRIAEAVEKKKILIKTKHTPNCQRGVCKNNHFFCSFSDEAYGFNEAIAEVLAIINPK